MRGLGSRVPGERGDAEIVEERDAEFRACLGEAEHDVASAAACVGHDSAGDFALGDEGADVVFGGVGVEGDFRPLEHAQEFALSGEQAFEDAVERGVAGSSLEDAVEAGAQFGGSGRARGGAPGRRQGGARAGGAPGGGRSIPLGAGRAGRLRGGALHLGRRPAGRLLAGKAPASSSPQTTRRRST